MTRRGSSGGEGARREVRTSLDPIEVRDSPIEGLGIFARRPLAAGERIRRVAYVREVTDAAPLRPEAGERAEHCTYEDGRILLVAWPDRHMNHSCDPNAYYAFDADGVFVTARRPIASGEELTVDYLINNPGGDSWTCRCGTARCRGSTGDSFFTLPSEIQREYLPLLAPWFRRRFAGRLGERG